MHSLSLTYGALSNSGLDSDSKGRLLLNLIYVAETVYHSYCVVQEARAYHGTTVAFSSNYNGR